MISLITILVFILTAIVSRYQFKRWFNHVFTYALSWCGSVLLIELDFINYTGISPLAWMAFIIAYGGILSGALTVHFARQAKGLPDIHFGEKLMDSPLLQGDARLIRNLIIVFSALGLFSAIQYWMVLVNKFGSIAMVLARGNLVYRMRVAGEVEGVIPYINVLSYAGVVLGGLYVAARGKFSIVAFLPLLAVIIEGMASVGRGGIFFSMLFFMTSIILARYALSREGAVGAKSNRGLVTGSLVVLSVLIASMVIVKNIRGSYDTFKGQNQSIKQLNKVPLVSPSVYMYFSANMVVFSKYLQFDNEKTLWGENTLLPVQNVLAKFGVVKKPKIYPKGYYVPMWTNSATYLRDLHADYGPIGLFLVPYFFSLLVTVLWYRFFERKNLSSYFLLVYFQIVVTFSVFFSITRAAFWIMSLMVLLILIPALEKYALRRGAGLLDSGKSGDA